MNAREKYRRYLFLQVWQPGVAKQQQREALREIAVNRVLTAQFTAQFKEWRREQVERNAELERMLRELSHGSTEGIADKLQDEQPAVRWLAALVAHRKRMPLEKELIERLTDSQVQVREAARQALVKLSRGNDFGPTAKATAAQVAQAQQAWRHWLSMQEMPGRTLSASEVTPK
ncbi:MAG: hypothetical protein L0Z62_50875 [Gemmataceae bacterium]|nr:hypothetical protein [Gemmataceae bacterium]